jgi:hypothetical protein
VEGAEAPESFQVAFDGIAAKGVGFAFEIGDAPVLAPLPTAGAAAGPVEPGGGAGSAISGALSSSGSAGPLAGTAQVAPVGAAAPAADPVVAAPAAAATTPVSAPVAMPAWYSGIPAAGYVLLPLLLGLAYLLMLALGPDAQPAAGPSQNGVARALERLRAAGTAITSRGRS